MSATIASHPNIFPKVVIGSQIWASRNYDFGGSNPNDDWYTISDYGKLYTWAEAMAINIPGWRLPTSDDFITLVAELGTNSIAGGKLKEVGTTYWTAPNEGADNSSGFSARGAGANVSQFNTNTYFWSSTEDSDPDNAYALMVNNTTSQTSAYYMAKIDRLSVRLIEASALELVFDNIINVPVANAELVSDWNTFFDLPTYGVPFTSVKVSYNTIRLYGGRNITLKSLLFSTLYTNDPHLISIIDNVGSIENLESNVFRGHIVTGYATLTSIYLPAVSLIADGSFGNCHSLLNISIPSCINLGISTGYDFVFEGIVGQSISLTIPAALMTTQEGTLPDGDIQYLQLNSTVTIIQV